MKSDRADCSKCVVSRRRLASNRVHADPILDAELFEIVRPMRRRSTSRDGHSELSRRRPRVRVSSAPPTRSPESNLGISLFGGVFEHVHRSAWTAAARSRGSCQRNLQQVVPAIRPSRPRARTQSRMRAPQSRQSAHVSREGLPGRSGSADRARRGGRVVARRSRLRVHCRRGSRAGAHRTRGEVRDGTDRHGRRRRRPSRVRRSIPVRRRVCRGSSFEVAIAEPEGDQLAYSDRVSGD